MRQFADSLTRMIALCLHSSLNARRLAHHLRFHREPYLRDQGFFEVAFDSLAEFDLATARPWMWFSGSGRAAWRKLGIRFQSISMDWIRCYDNAINHVSGSAKAAVQCLSFHGVLVAPLA